MKKAFCIGATAGGLLGVIISLSMDWLLGNAIGGSWCEAVAHDLNYFFNTHLSENHVLVILGVFIVIGIIVAFGALLGGALGALINRLFGMLTQEKKSR